MDDLKHYPALLADIAEQGGLKLAARGIDEAVAAEVAFELAEWLRKTHWSGQQVYVGKGTRYEHYQRDLEIWNKFNGTNHSQLAGEYGLTVVRIYQIIKAITDQERRRRQPDLFQGATTCD